MVRAALRARAVLGLVVRPVLRGALAPVGPGFAGAVPSPKVRLY